MEKNKTPTETSGVPKLYGGITAAERADLELRMAQFEARNRGMHGLYVMEMSQGGRVIVETDYSNPATRVETARLARQEVPQAARQDMHMPNHDERTEAFLSLGARKLREEGYAIPRKPIFALAYGG